MKNENECSYDDTGLLSIEEKYSRAIEKIEKLTRELYDERVKVLRTEREKEDKSRELIRVLSKVETLATIIESM